MWREWHDSASPGFRFGVKANRYLTHMKRFKETGPALKRFLDGARLLKSFLGPVLYQAPPNFERTEAKAECLDAFLSALPGSMRNVVEFRHDSWAVDETLAMLRRHHVALCIQDMPGLKCPVEATAGFAYVRLHRHEKAYEADYGEEALNAWAQRLRGLGTGRLEEVWVYFNNDLGGHAVKNARRLKEMLGVTTEP